jgi:predicted TIM-barrel enzyme
LSSYRELFPKKAFLVVIHVEGWDQAVRNADIAFKAGADGIFLINHRIDAPELLRIYETIRVRYPKEFIGLNFLRCTPVEALGIYPKDASALWCDDGGVREDDEDPVKFARIVGNFMTNMGFHGIYFGGVAFKYQTEVQNHARVAELASPYMNVITTSGESTGYPPTLNKIMVIRQAIGDFKPLAVASGMNPNNVDAYLPFVDCFMVATGISRSFTELDPGLVEAMALKVHR